MELMETIEMYMLKYGLLTVFIIVALEYANVPLPSEVVLPFVGFFVSLDVYDLHEAILVSIVAGVIGSLTNYYLGYFAGEPCTNMLIKKFPKTEKSIVASKDLLNKYGKLSVIFARFLPLARTIISIPAGVIKMNVLLFITLTVIGITIWNSVLIGLGVFLGDQFYMISDLLHKYYLMLIPIVVLIGTVILYRNREALKLFFITKNNTEE